MKAPLFIPLTCALAVTSVPAWTNQVQQDQQNQHAKINEISTDVALRPNQMNLLKWDGNKFYEHSKALVQDLSASRGQERNLVLLEIVELYLSQSMLRESKSILKDIDKSGFSEKTLHRLQEVLDAAAILDGQKLENPESSTLLTGNRRDASFWRTLHAIAAGDATTLFNNIGATLKHVDSVPPPVLRSVLPALIETLIEIREFELAAHQLSLLAQHPEYQSSSTVEFLNGRLMELQDNNKSALDHYFEAAQGWDKYAARARLRIANMAIDNGGKGALLAATDVLNVGVNTWRGDDIELQTLQALAQVNHLTDQTFQALLTNNRLILRFPNSEAAKLAFAEAEVDLRSLYHKGAQAEFTLSEWHVMHNRLAPTYRKLSIFAESTEIIADSTLTHGATRLAILEYNRAIKLRLENLNGNHKQPDAIILTQLKIVRAMTVGGQFLQARVLLDEIQETKTAALNDLKGELMVRVLSAVGSPKDVLASTTQTPSSAFLRQTAFASWNILQWDDAISSYRRLWIQYPESFGLEDATYMLIAAHRNGDAETEGALVKKFPELTLSLHLAQLANDLLEAPSSITPLRSNEANARVARAMRILDHINGGDP